MTLISLVYSRQWDRAAGLISDWFGVPVSADWLAETCEALFASQVKGDGCLQPRGGTDNSLLMWVKARLNRDGKLNLAHQPPPQISILVEMHIGFLFLEETPEMLARLPETSEGTLMPSQTARSKVFSTPLYPHPVDRVAARVAPEEK